MLGMGGFGDDDPILQAELLEDRAREAFHSYDLNGNGKIEENEMRRLLKAEVAGAGIADADFEHFVKQTFNAADRDGDGQITFAEFVLFFNGLQELKAEHAEAGAGAGTGSGAAAAPGGAASSKYAAAGGGEASTLEDDGDEFDLDFGGDAGAALGVGASLGGGGYSLGGGSGSGSGGGPTSGGSKRMMFAPTGSAQADAISDYRASHGWDEAEFTNVVERLREAADGSGISEDAFVTVMKEFGLFRGQERFVRGLFKSFDVSGDGAVDVAEVEAGLKVFHNGESNDVMRFVFRAYDSDGDGCVTKPELGDMVAPFVETAIRLMRSAADFIRDEAEAFGGDAMEEKVAFKETAGSTVVSGAENSDGSQVHVTLVTKAGSVEVDMPKVAFLQAGGTAAEAFTRLQGPRMRDAIVELAFADYDRDGDATLSVDEWVDWAVKQGVVAEVLDVFQ